MKLEEPRRTAYVEAYERWHRDLDAMHRVLLEGDSMDPLHFVALLRRESKSKERYDQVRSEVLGLPGGAEEEDPFA